MGATILLSDFNLITNILRVTKPVFAFNQTMIVKKHFPKNECYALMKINETSNRLEGSVSWQLSGFDYEIYYLKDSHSKKLSITTKIKPHSKWIPSDLTLAESMIEELILESHKRCQIIIDSKKETKIPTGFTFSKKKSGKTTPKFIANMAYAKSASLFTDQFYNFAMSNSHCLTATKR